MPTEAIIEEQTMRHATQIEPRGREASEVRVRPRLVVESLLFWILVLPFAAVSWVILHLA